MKTVEKQMQETEVVTEITCDCCGKSCKTEYGFEAMKLEKFWGFMSNKDLEHWEAYLCERCVDEKLSFINFKKGSYIPRMGNWWP